MRSWAAKTQNPSSPWIQVDLKDTVVITAIKTQGGDYEDYTEYYSEDSIRYQENWIGTLQVQYGDMDTDLRYIMDGDQAKVGVKIIIQFARPALKETTEHWKIQNGVRGGKRYK